MVESGRSAYPLLIGAPMRNLRAPAFPHVLISLAALAGLVLAAGASAADLARDGDRCAAWGVMRTAHGLAADPHACAQKSRDQLDVLLLPRASLTERDADFDADVVVWLGSDADTLAVRIEGRGVLSSATDEFRRVGRWSAGDTFDFAVHVPRVEGEGALHVHVTSLAADGSPLHAAASELFIWNDGAETWWSPLGRADLQLSRAAALVARGDLDPEASRAAREAAIGSLVEPATRPQARRPATHVEQQMDRAFASQREALEAANDDPPVAEAVVSDVTVNGTVRWSDSSGALQPAAFATVEVRDNEAIGSELVATTMTNALGQYEVNFDHDDGDGEGAPDIFVRVIARSFAAAVGPSTDPDDAYFVQSAGDPQEAVAGGTLTFDFDLSNANNDAHTAFSVHTGLVWIAWYTGELSGSTPSRLTVMFPGTGSFFRSSGPWMSLLRLDRFDWDVLHHEYGHYVARIHELSNSPGGAHNSTANLWDVRSNKSEGVRLAWGEGWPTFFGTAGQTSAALEALGIPNVGDIRYTDTEDSSADYSLESQRGVGEDNERSVMTSMWDLFDIPGDGLDRSSFSDKFLFDTLSAARVTTAGRAWEALSASQNDAGKARMGGAMGRARIAPELLEPPDQFEPLGPLPPTFKWKKNGAGEPNPLNKFKVVFFENDFSAEIFEKELADVAEYTPTNNEWNTILAGDEIIRWVVQGQNTDSPFPTPAGVDGYYWSAARSIGGAGVAFVIDDTESMTDEIAAVKTALQSYIDLVESSLQENEMPPTIQVMTFKDDVTTRAISNDLEEIRSAVGALAATDGEDCPEFSSQALEQAADAVLEGGTILFATDASSQPGVDIAALIQKLRAKSITVNTILSGECLDFGKEGGRPNQLAASGSQSRVAAAEKPGDDESPDDEEADEPIEDPSQPVIDVHGNTLESATRLVVGGGAVPGSVANALSDPVNPDREDWFVVALEEGVSYVIKHPHISGEGAQLFIRDATTQFGSGLIGATRPGRTIFVPNETADYHLQVFANPDAAYRLSVSDDPLDGLFLSAVELYSTISAATGGAFLVRDGVKFSDDEPYISAVFNVMATTVGPAVISANPTEAPRETAFGITLKGGNTNWRNGTQVGFSGGGITVNSVNVLSPTSLVALVEIGAAAGLGMRDVTVTTPLGGGTETALGVGVVEVTTAPFFPAILSVEPSTLERGSSQTLLVRGVKTDWSDGATVQVVDVGGFVDDPRITVGNVDVLSKTLIEVDVDVGPGAALGFRPIEVSSGGEEAGRNRALFVEVGDIDIAEVDALNPRSALPGVTLEVSVDASNTNFEEGSTEASFGPGIEVLSVVVESATSATVEIEIDPEAPEGFRDVVMTTDGERAAFIDGFFIGDLLATNVLPENGKFSGCLAPGGESVLSFDVPVNRAIEKFSLEGIKVKGESVGKLKQADLFLVDPLEGAERLGKLKKGKVLKGKNARLALAGEHALIIRDTKGSGGCFKGRAKVRPSESSIRFGACLDAGETLERAFTAQANSTMTKLSVEGVKKKLRKLVPEVSLVSPAPSEIVFDPAVGKAVVVKGESLDEAGDWVVRVTGSDGAAGCFEAKLKVEQGGS